MSLSRISGGFCWWLLLFFCCLAHPSLSVCPDGCVCNFNDAQVNCNSDSSSTGTLFIGAVVESLRTGGMEGSVTHLTVIGASDTTLVSNTFSGFTSLRQLAIQFASDLSLIEPGAFNNLSQLEALQLCENNLEWLSADLFAGIGTSLNRLELAGNQLRYLREDLRPFFSSIGEIDLRRNRLDCDCHLQWLADLLLDTSLTPPVVRGAECGATSITDASVDFSICQDVCDLGFHNCHPSATCNWNGDTLQVTCTCLPGYAGDGIVCNQVCETELNNCHDNATCQWAGTGLQITCSCNSGFVGNGVTCEPCQSLCSAGMHCVVDIVSYCTCNDGYVLQGEQCVQDVMVATCLGERASGYIWPETAAGTTVQLPCGTQGDSPTVSRSCDGRGIWEGVVAPQCVSQAVQGLQQQAPLCSAFCTLENAEPGTEASGLRITITETSFSLSVLRNDPAMDPLLMSFTMNLLETTVNISFSGDVPAIVDLLRASIDLLSEEDLQQNIPISYENLVSVGSELLDNDNQLLWLQLNDTEVADNIVGLFAGIDEIGRTLLDQGSVDGFLNISTENIALLIFQPESTDNGTCIGEAISVSSALLSAPVEGPASSLDLPASLLSDAFRGEEFECTDVGIVAVVYDGAGPLLSLDGANSLLPDTGCDPTETRLAHGMCMWYGNGTVCPVLQVNSVIISAIVVSNNENQTVNTSRLSEPILVTLQHEDTALEQPVCTFLNEQEVNFQQGGSDVSWLTEGCSVLNTSRNMTVCQCFHLTSFALLMSPTGPPGGNQPLHIASKVGLSVSIICLIITIVLLFSLKLKEKLHHVHRQLAIALCLSQLVFLVAVDRTSVPTPDWLCTSVAALLHYLLLCTFAWQLTEGIHLYLFIVKVFFNEKIVWLYYPLAWGIPLVIVAVTLGVRFCDYGSEYYCWISTGRGTNWAFHGPVIAVLVVNIVILLVVTTVIVRAARRKEENACLFFTLLHASLVLVPILGVTWALGFFVVGDSIYSDIVEWLFFAFSSLQGVFIFIMHCILNRDVRVAFLKAIGCRAAAHRQTTTMRQSRRLSTQTSFGSMFRQTFYRGRKQSSSSSLKNGFQMNGIDIAESSDAFSSGSLKNFITAKPKHGHRNPLALENIDEESEIEASHCYSPASASASNTPKNGTPSSYKRTTD